MLLLLGLTSLLCLRVASRDRVVAFHSLVALASLALTRFALDLEFALCAHAFIARINLRTLR
jgi:hypothetical protein